jgi:hypothetical protein
MLHLAFKSAAAREQCILTCCALSEFVRLLLLLLLQGDLGASAA